MPNVQNQITLEPTIVYRETQRERKGALMYPLSTAGISRSLENPRNAESYISAVVRRHSQNPRPPSSPVSTSIYILDVSYSPPT